MKWIWDALRWLQESIQALNEQLKPFADDITQLHAAPLYIVGAFIAGLAVWLWRTATAGARERAKAAEIQVIIEKAIISSLGNALTAASPGKTAQEQLREALNEILAADAIRGRKTAELLAAGQVLEAGALSRQIATDAEGDLARITGAAEQARKAAARRWRDAGAISFLSLPKEALTAYERARALDPSDHEITLEMASLYQRLGRFKEADALYAEVLEDAKSTPLQRAQATGGQGGTAQARGDLQAAEALHRKAHAQMEALGNQAGQAGELLSIGNIARLAGNLQVAEDCLSRAQSFYQAVGNPGAVAAALVSRGAIAGEDGSSSEKATQLYREALAIYEKLDDQVGQANVRLNLGVEAWRRKELADAEASYRAALNVYKLLGDSVAEGQALLNIAEIYVEQNKLDEARPMLERADVLLKQADVRVGQFYIAALLARIDWKRGLREPAEARWRELLADSRNLGLTAVASEILRILACEGLTEASI